MKVVIQDLEGRQYDITGVETGQQVKKLKMKIQGFTGVAPVDQTLMYLGQELVDDTLLSDYGIVDECMINMVHRSVGGEDNNSSEIRQPNILSYWVKTI